MIFFQISFSESSSIHGVPWRELGCEIVFECTGVHLTLEELTPYMAAGVQKVICSYPLKESSIVNVVFGVNDDKLTKEMPVCTASSGTTNCLGPVIKVRNHYCTTININFLGIMFSSKLLLHDF